MIFFRKNRGEAGPRRSNSGDSEAITSIIDKEMAITGNLVFQGKTLLDGKVEGNIRGEYLIISESGKILGDVEAEVVVCQGRVDGNIKAGRLHAKNAAAINGILEVDDLAVDYGASLDGEVKARSMDLRLVEGAAAAQQQLPSAPPVQKQKKEVSES